MPRTNDVKVTSSGAGKEPCLSQIKTVDIDNGRFKYVLIKAVHEKSQEFKYIVRGKSWAEYHADIYEKVEDELTSKDLDIQCVGGGRIEHDPSGKKIQVYGYSMGYGKADHSITTQVLKEHFKNYKEITFSDSGY